MENTAALDEYLVRREREGGGEADPGSDRGHV
jgi:hypothetical protein